MVSPIAYHSGKFVPAEELSLPPQDAGFVLGVTVAEQLRTFGGRLFAWEEHCSRLARGLEIVGLDQQVDLSQVAAASVEVARHNHALLADGDDLGVTVFITPGVYSTYRPGADHSPTVGIHTYPLPFALWADKYRQGQRCIISPIRQVSADSWPRELKCRSRVHYYLADQHARQVDPHARAILLDERGDVNEASTSNVIAYFADAGFVSPPLADILPGVSLQTAARLAAKLRINFHYRRLSVAELRAADAVILSSTPNCLLPVSALDGMPLPVTADHPAARLLTAWSAEVGVDIVHQARRFSSRAPT